MIDEKKVVGEGEGPPTSYKKADIYKLHRDPIRQADVAKGFRDATAKS